MLSALRTVFTMHNEECSLTDLQTQLRASHPHQTFERHEIDAILAALEEEKSWEQPDPSVDNVPFTSLDR